MKIQNTKKHAYLFWGEIALFIMLLYGISSCVYLNGDDFMYGAFAKTGIVQNVTGYYFTGNGRYWINILNSVLLWFDRYGFIVILPWIVLTFVVLFAKNVQRIMCGHSDWQNEKRLIRMGMVLFACLDVMCLRETVFWITGMMNYLFPAVLFLLGYLLFQKSRASEISGISLALYYAVCLLVSSSVEQYALMFVGMMTLHHGYDLIKKVRIPAYEWLAYGLSILSLAALILAPGNFVRVDYQGAISPPFIDNAWTLLYQDTFSPVALPYFFMLSLAILLQQNGQGNTVPITKRYIYFVFLVGVIISPFVDKAIFDIALLAVLSCALIRHIYIYIYIYISSQDFWNTSRLFSDLCRHRLSDHAADFRCLGIPLYVEPLPCVYAYHWMLTISCKCSTAVICPCLRHLGIIPPCSHTGILAVYYATAQ